MIFSVSIIGRILVGIVCLVQVDIKRLIAYSSVVHINLILCRIMTLFNLGFLSRYIMIISHGLCSSGLFYILNIYYRRTISRLLILNKGLIRKLSILILWWFLLCPTKHETYMQGIDLFHSDFKWNILYIRLWYNSLMLQLKHFKTSYIINISNVYSQLICIINVSEAMFHMCLKITANLHSQSTYIIIVSKAMSHMHLKIK